MKFISRKSFVGRCFIAGAGMLCAGNNVFSRILYPKTNEDLYEAMYWQALAGDMTECILCPNNCILGDGSNGLCHSRGNREGVLYSLVFAKPAVLSLDDVEKAPLYHFKADRKVLSIATSGCNLACEFCQNWEISQVSPDDIKSFDLRPDEVVERAVKHNVSGINFFYTEPTIYYEYMLEIAKLAKEAKLATFCITAAYINEEPLIELIPNIDAFVIGLKGFDNEFYKKYIGGELDIVKNSIKILSENKEKTWFEIVNLLIPDLNDDPEKIKQMCEWLQHTVGNDVPVHFTKFEPAYNMPDHRETPIETIEMAYDIAKEAGLNYVYIGNIPGHDGNNTYCSECGKMLIERVNYSVINEYHTFGKCPCGKQLSGKWLNYYD